MKIILFWIVLCALPYLIISLYEWNLHVNEWPREIRLILCVALTVITGISAMVFMMITFPPPENKN